MQSTKKDIAITDKPVRVNIYTQDDHRTTTTINPNIAKFFAQLQGIYNDDTSDDVDNSNIKYMSLVTHCIQEFVNEHQSECYDKHTIEGLLLKKIRW